LPYFSRGKSEITYDLYHGYTKLDKDNVKAAYPFGFGLSYTSYKYQNVEAKQKDKHVEISVSVKNIGKIEGEEVVQVYVGMIDSKIERQKKLLKDFTKVTLKPGENKRVTMIVPINELKYYNEEITSWQLETGTYQFFVGSSSDENDLIQEELYID